MTLPLVIIYILILVIFYLVAFAVFQIKSAGMKVKDFWTFIKANETLTGSLSLLGKTMLTQPAYNNSMRSVMFTSHLNQYLKHYYHIPICTFLNNTIMIKL